MDGIGDIFSGLSSLLEGLVRSVFYAFRRLFAKPKDGGSRLRPRHLIHAAMPIAGFFACLFAIYYAVVWSHARNQRLREQTEKIVEAEAERLWNRIDKDGRLIEVAVGEPPINDSWGRQIVVTTDRGILNDKVVVRSLGEDGDKGTLDDIVAIRSRINEDQEIAEEAMGRLIGFAKENLNKNK